MATWKKVVVSGSAVSQLNNDSGYLVSGQSSEVTLSGSFSGSFQGDGSNLSGITADTLGNSLTDGNGISDFSFNGSGAASVAVEADGSTLSVGSGGVKVADAGITATQLATSVAGDGLAGGAGTALSVNTDGTSITTSGDSLTLAGTTFSSSVESRISTNEDDISSLQSFSSSLDATFATEAEVNAATASLSSSLADDIATNATNVGTAQNGVDALTAETSSYQLAANTNTLSGSLAGRIASQEAFSSSLDATFATEAEVNAATASLSGSLANDIATNATDVGTAQDGVDALTAATASYANSASFASGIKTNADDIGDLQSNVGTAQDGVDALTAATASYANSASFASDISGLDSSKQDNISISDTSGQGGIDLTFSSDTLSGTTVGLGASDNVQFANITATGDVSVTGDLTVSGTTTSINTTNLDVEDKFILLNSGSTNPDEGGIVIDEGSGTGHAFLLDSTSTRFGFKASLDSTTTSDVTPEAFASAVVDEAAGHSDAAEYQKNGNIRVTSGGDIFIYS
jgi:filamentous hemagglutinin